MRRAPATAVALTTLALALAACMLDRRGNPNPDSGVTNSSGAAVSTGAGGASSSSGKGGSGGTGQGGKGAGGLGAGGSGGMGIPPLDCSSLDLWACYPFDGDTKDYAGEYDFAGEDQAFVSLPGGSAFDVSGSGQHAADGPNQSATALTIEMCFNAKSLPNENTAYHLYARDEWALVYIWNSPNDVPRLGFRPGAGPHNDDTSTSLMVGKWHHVAVVYDGMLDEQSIYIDGSFSSSVATTDLVAPVDSGVATTLGYPGIGSMSDFDGHIDNLRIFNSVRTDQEISAAAANCPKKVATARP